MTLWKKNETPASEPEQDENESTFDIMLCDYCDAELYSEEAYVVSKIILRRNRDVFQVAICHPMLSDFISNYGG